MTSRSMPPLYRAVCIIVASLFVATIVIRAAIVSNAPLEPTGNRRSYFEVISATEARERLVDNGKLSGVRVSGILSLHKMDLGEQSIALDTVSVPHGIDLSGLECQSINLHRVSCGKLMASNLNVKVLTITESEVREDMTLHDYPKSARLELHFNRPPRPIHTTSDTEEMNRVAVALQGVSNSPDLE